MAHSPSSPSPPSPSLQPALRSHEAATKVPHPNVKSIMYKGFRSMLSWGGSGSGEPKPTVTTLFPKVDPAVDGDDCDHECATCTITYPKGFKIEESMELYGGVKPWQTHLVVATGKTDWSREVADEKGSVMEAVGSLKGLKLSASNMPLPADSSGYQDPTSVLLLPAMTLIDNVLPGNVPTLVKDHVEPSIKTTTRLGSVRRDGDTANGAANGQEASRGAADTLAWSVDGLGISDRGTASDPEGEECLDSSSRTVPAGLALRSRPCPHNALILLCSQRTRDVRCGQSAPLIRRELERHLRPMGLYRDLDDERPGGVGIYFISHIGGHKWSANVLIYRRADPWGVDGTGWREGGVHELVRKAVMAAGKERAASKEGAAQCIWLARVNPEDCEGIVKYTVLQGKVVKPEWQLRGGFDRGKGLVSW